ncbi:MAG: hypothetical protein ACKO7P_13095 [Bacteroidota bacterium]
MALENLGSFPYHIDKIVSNKHCLEFIQSFIDYEAFGKVNDMINKINSTPNLKKMYGENIKKVPNEKKAFNLNIGFYRPGRKFKGEIIKEPEVTMFYELSENADPIQINLPERANTKLEGLTSEVPSTKTRRTSVLAPSRWSMKTAGYNNERGGVVLIIPNNITAKSSMIRVYCGYRYGPMMGHGNKQIWRKTDSGWKISSYNGTWIS